MVTNATAYFSSSDKDNDIFAFFFSFLLIVRFVLPSSLINGLPFFSFSIIISLKFIPLDIPVPNALAKASFAANLFA